MFDDQNVKSLFLSPVMYGDGYKHYWPDDRQDWFIDEPLGFYRTLRTVSSRTWSISMGPMTYSTMSSRKALTGWHIRLSLFINSSQNSRFFHNYESETIPTKASSQALITSRAWGLNPTDGSLFIPTHMNCIRERTWSSAYQYSDHSHAALSYR